MEAVSEELPEYTATYAVFPVALYVVAHVAAAADNVTVVQPAIGDPLSKNVTDPVAVAGETAAVNETEPVGCGGLGLTVTVTDDAVLDAEPITTFDEALTALVSCEVATLNVTFAYVPDAGFVIPGIESVPDVDAARVHPVGSVTVATFPVTESFAAGHARPNPVNVTDCPEAMVKFGLNTTLTVLEGASAPEDDGVNPTVHVEAVLAAVEPGANVAVPGDEANAAVAKSAPPPPSATRPTTATTSFLER